MGMLTDQSLESGCINKTSLSRMPQLGMFTDQNLESESLLAGCVVSGQSGGSQTVGILQTLFVGCVLSGQSGEFRTVGILRILCLWAV